MTEIVEYFLVAYSATVALQLIQPTRYSYISTNIHKIAISYLFNQSNCWYKFNCLSETENWYDDLRGRVKNMEMLLFLHVYLMN